MKRNSFQIHHSKIIKQQRKKSFKTAQVKDGSLKTTTTTKSSPKTKEQLGDGSLIYSNNGN